MLIENKRRGLVIVGVWECFTKKLPEIHEVGVDHLNADPILFCYMKVSSSKLKSQVFIYSPVLH